MTIAQREYADAHIYSDPLPAVETARGRLEQLFRDLRGALITVAAKEKQLKRPDSRFEDYEDAILNKLGQAQQRAAVLNVEIDDAILEAAEQIKVVRGAQEAATV